MAVRKHTVERIGWPDGMVTSGNVLERPVHAALLLRNWDLLIDGTIQMRRPVQRVAQQITASNVPVAVNGMAPYRTVSVNQLILAAGTQWWRWTVPSTATDPATSAVSAISGGTGFTANTAVQFLRWRDATRDWLIGANGTDAVRYYDGSSVATLDMLDHTGGGLTDYVFGPMERFHGYLWGAEAESVLVRRSELLQPHRYNPNSFYTLDTEDGYGIIALRKHGESLFVLGRNTIEIIDGRSPASFQNYTLSTAHGTVNPHTVRSTEQGLFWLDEDGVYAAVPGRGVIRASITIDDVFRTMDYTQFASARAVVVRNPRTKRNEYRLAITQERDHRINTFVVRKCLDTDNVITGWHVDTGYQATAWAVGKDLHDMDVLYSGTEQGVIQRHDQERGHPAEQVSVAFIDNPLHFGDQTYTATAQDLLCYYQASTPMALDVLVVADFRGDTVAATWDLSADSVPPTIFSADLSATIKGFLEHNQARTQFLGGIGLQGYRFLVRLAASTGKRDARVLGYTLSANVVHQGVAP